jgi:biopolymer transport protein TolQ
MQAPIQSFSFISLFLQTDPVVKAVIALLILASIAVWTIIIDKSIRFSSIRRDLRGLLSALADPTYKPASGTLSGVVMGAGLIAAADKTDIPDPAERRDRLREAMRLALLDALREAEPGLPFLATVGSTAPFVGLFGTVWGIMGSFTGIAAANDTSLAVVAPGIAEALLSTAVGLAAAIPAVVAYNKLTAHLANSRAVGLSAIARLAQQLGKQGSEAVRLAAE